jgi:hypothetical protein
MRVSRAIEIGRIAYFLPERCIRKRDRPMSAGAPLPSRSKVVGSGVIVATNVAWVVGGTGKVMFELKLNRPSVVWMQGSWLGPPHAGKPISPASVIGPIPVAPSYPVSALLPTNPIPVIESKAGGLSTLPIMTAGTVERPVGAGIAQISDGSVIVAVPTPRMVTVIALNGLPKIVPLKREVTLAVSPIPVSSTDALVNVVAPISPEATPDISYVIGIARALGADERMAMTRGATDAVSLFTDPPVVSQHCKNHSFDLHV